MTPREVDWICDDCAIKNGAVITEGHTVTCHEGSCGVCEQVRIVTEPRDYRWPLEPT